MTVKEGIALLGAGEGIEDLLASNWCAPGDQATSEELCVYGNIGVHAEEGC
jgi:hypothetical protein